MELAALGDDAQAVVLEAAEAIGAALDEFPRTKRHLQEPAGRRIDITKVIGDRLQAGSCRMETTLTARREVRPPRCVITSTGPESRAGYSRSDAPKFLLQPTGINAPAC